MAEEHLSLKWNNHQAHFVDILTFLREKGMFVDVTLACGGKIYSAHKFVLSTCSDYFQKIFSKNTSTNPIVFMKDVSCNDIEALLDFMYHGEVNVPQSSLGSLIKTAEGLQIKGLAVPDDPPSSRKKQDRDKRERDPSSSSHYESRSPPPKRRSRNSPPPPPRRSNARAIPPPVEACLDNDTDDVVLRNSEPSTNNHDRHSSSGTHNKKLHQRASHDSSEDLSSDGKGVNDKDLNQESHDPEAHPASGADDASEQDAGPSGLRQSKQEEVEIKQEDVVELGEDDDDGVDWGGGMGDDGGGGDGNNDGLNSGDNSVSFSDVLLPPPEGGGGLMDGTGTGDSAMVGGLRGVRPYRRPGGADNLTTSSYQRPRLGQLLSPGRHLQLPLVSTLRCLLLSHLPLRHYLYLLIQLRLLSLLFPPTTPSFHLEKLSGHTPATNDRSYARCALNLSRGKIIC
ncbi:protein abrupt isoform X20 [Hyalella azteca]|uniref:Protein abrupt isoform X20 n=1 Tax=Hyalella azteca TaxID=294128 RepID=A0A8B7PFH5_HYAAZ|nr:protein abrupt isoform X20 [Hyalella azteca]